jgi:glycosyltransferase involved in cell wall biosynthesis
VRISIVTPSFRQFEWLKRCARSVSDQAGDVEHIIQDGGTGSELEQWVREHTSARLYAEPDGGMYDALNRGFARAEGDVLAWLNCDEQYLPGALRTVEERFAAEQDLDVLLADNLIVDAGGKYMAHRFSLIPTAGQMWVRFPVASCALFFRRRAWRPFDTQWKSVGDWWWFRDLMASGVRIGILRQFVSAFTETHANLGLAPVTAPEHARMMAARPAWARLGRPLLIAYHRWRMWRSGTFGVRPFRYRLYTGNSTVRTEFVVDKPTGRWLRPTGTKS